MPTSAQILGKFAAELQLSDIPAAPLERAKECIIDAIGVATFGSQLPWSQMVTQYATLYGTGGPCSVLGVPGTRVHAPYAALANGVFVHSFEHDSFRDPSVGAHPGATVMPAVLAACEEVNADGKTGLTAFVAGCEVLFRVAMASHHSQTSPEKLGFHAPGLTGPFAAAAAAGRVFGLNAEQMTNAFGIAGSLSSGLLAFTKANTGGMIKRLHMGRASESGMLAAALARAGYTGPETVLEGKFGFLEVFCRGGDPKLLTAGLGEEWETKRIGMKRYSCHMNANIPVQAIRTLMQEHKFNGADVESVVLEGTEKLMHHPSISEPGDVGQAQYSVQFCVALALFRDPDDPKSFDESALADTRIRALCRTMQIRQRTDSAPSLWSCRVIVKLKDGREVSNSGDSVKGMLANPFTRPELRHKFDLLTTNMSKGDAAKLFESLEHLEAQPRFLPA